MAEKLECDHSIRSLYLSSMQVYASYQYRRDYAATLKTSNFLASSRALREEEAFDLVGLGPMSLCASKAMPLAPKKAQLLRRTMQRPLRSDRTLYIKSTICE